MATSRPRLNSTTPHTEAGQQQDVDLGFERRRYVGRRLRTDRNASDRRAPQVAPETEPETNRYARVHSQSIVEWTP